MDIAKYRIKFMEPFKDGNLFPERKRLGEEVVVDADLVAKIRQSGGVIEVLGTMIPNPLKHAPAASEAPTEPPAPAAPKKGRKKGAGSEA